MPTLNWIGKDAVVNHDKEVPFRLLKKEKFSSVGNSQNLVIHGDNLEALKALMPFYAGKVKCIYIDPPYNTGNEGWVYNDKVNSPKIRKWLGKVVGRDLEDLCRHDKWLCMMYPRVKLLKDLLSDDGAIFVSIDDVEQSNLRALLDDIFGEDNFITNVIWEKNYSPRNDAKYFSASHDFILIYAKSKSKWNRNLLLRTEKQNKYYKFDDNDGRGLWRPDNVLVKTFSESGVFGIKNPNTGETLYPPRGSCYRFSAERAKQLLVENKFYFGKDGMGKPQLKRYLSEVKQGVVPQTIWRYEEVGHNQTGKNELNKLVGMNVFDSPKPVSLIKHILQIATDKNDLVLDSFAGSGTTGHAVLDLNKEDSGDRKFILVEMEDSVAKDVTAQRIKRAIKQYDYKDGFEYCELSKPLFDEKGQIENTCSFDQFATYIYFTETQTNIDPAKVSGNYIGEYAETEYYLIYKEKSENVLSKLFLKMLRKTDGVKVIYADKCLLDDDTLEKHNIIFKQIPYEVKIY
ncbi:MAG: site-specific DNA-methyltransferase [Candidatus Peregrinibacteria bacterium]|nr:site-specific DNA-methyltransferase [Candidatus Peregrinibacteria bacterium]